MKQLKKSIQEKNNINRLKGEIKWLYLKVMKEELTKLINV